MRGHERIIAMRRKGVRPAMWVNVEVGLRADLDLIMRFNGTDRAPGLPWSTNVCIEPSESARLADWGWAVGLMVRVNGDDEPRVMAAYEGLMRAGAARVVATWPVWHDSEMDMGLLDSEEIAA